jgi:hypothetical protein
MAISTELMQAKEALSRRLLRAAVSARGAGLKRPMRIADAVAAAGSNVHAVGVGRKIVNGRETDTMAIRIHVVQKLAASAMDPAHRLPSNIDSIPTDVIESPLAYLASGIGAPAPVCTDARKQMQRPIVAGISAGYPAVFGGTIGYFCRSTRPGDDPAAVCVLSNNHIFANLNQANPGDPLYQPAPIDGGTAADTMATLKRWVSLQIDGNTPNSVDCAIGEMSAGVPYNVECCSIGAIGGTAQAVGDMAIRKHGRTSGYTEGKVTEESTDVTVALDQNESSVLVRFTNQIRIEPTGNYPAIGLLGDSGSLVVDANSQNAVGLYVANPENGAFAYANHIADVLAALQIALL